MSASVQEEKVTISKLLVHQWQNCTAFARGTSGLVDLFIDCTQKSAGGKLHRSEISGETKNMTSVSRFFRRFFFFFLSTNVHQCSQNVLVKEINAKRKKSQRQVLVFNQAFNEKIIK